IYTEMRAGKQGAAMFIPAVKDPATGAVANPSVWWVDYLTKLFDGSIYNRNADSFFSPDVTRKTISVNSINYKGESTLAYGDLSAKLYHVRLDYNFTYCEKLRLSTTSAKGSSKLLVFKGMRAKTGDITGHLTLLQAASNIVEIETPHDLVDDTNPKTNKPMRNDLFVVVVNDSSANLESDAIKTDITLKVEVVPSNVLGDLQQFKKISFFIGGLWTWSGGGTGCWPASSYLNTDLVWSGNGFSGDSLRTVADSNGNTYTDMVTVNGRMSDKGQYIQYITIKNRHIRNDETKPPGFDYNLEFTAHDVPLSCSSCPCSGKDSYIYLVSTQEANSHVIASYSYPWLNPKNEIVEIYSTKVDFADEICTPYQVGGYNANLRVSFSK
ncbi:MAG: hypothetical protein WCQ90_13940, partial [Deltaproteobacteria bacterium]